MLKILQARLQQYMNQELTDVQVGFRKGRGSRDQIANIPWITERTKQFQKNISFISYAKASDCVDHNKLWEILKEMGIPDHITCLLRNLYAGQAAVRTGHVPGGPVLRIWHSHCPGLGSIPGQGSLSPSSQPATYQSPKATTEPDMEQQTGSKLAKEYIKTVYSHSAR